MPPSVVCINPAGRASATNKAPHHSACMTGIYVYDLGMMKRWLNVVNVCN